MMRRVYEIAPIVVNSLKIKQIVIDHHVDKHADHIDDELIIRLVKALDNKIFIPNKEGQQFAYFANNINENGKWYKLVWLFEKNFHYIGVVTAHRDRRIV